MFEQAERQFKFPCTLNTDDISIDDNYKNKFSQQLIHQTKQALVDGFAKGVSLRDVSRSVKNMMYDKNGGNWLCVIKPSDVEVGLSFHQARVLQPSFTWNRMRYQVMIA